MSYLKILTTYLINILHKFTFLLKIRPKQAEEEHTNFMWQISEQKIYFTEGNSKFNCITDEVWNNTTVYDEVIKLRCHSRVVIDDNISRLLRYGEDVHIDGRPMD